MVGDNTTLSRDYWRWNLLTNFLLRDKDCHAELKTLLAEAPPVEWQDSTHYLHRAYLSLQLNDANNALAYSERALELNKHLRPALVNKALAFHMLNNAAEREKVIATLQSIDMGEHHKAAICAMKGDFSGCVSNLQRAFVLGRYTVKDACSDVAFRVFWGIPQFEESMLPFAKKEKLSYPYKEACPPTDVETSIRKSIEYVPS